MQLVSNLDSREDARVESSGAAKALIRLVTSDVVVRGVGRLNWSTGTGWASPT